MRNPRLAILAASGLLMAAIAVPAQDTKGGAEKKAAAPEKKMEAPKPGPEVKRLAYFVGTWNTDGDIKQNPMMPAGKMTSADKAEWFPGGFQVVIHSTGKSPMGPSHGLGILAYDAENKSYTYYGIDNSGFATLSKGSVDGKNWVFTDESKMGGKTYHGRYSMTEDSPTSYSFKYEMSEDGKSWSLIMEGKSTKAAAAAKM
jgi:Protein of unknown function (DUF1579)